MKGHEDVRCHHCDEVIGVYEPMVVLHDGVPVRTSRAAAELDPLATHACFHAQCFTSIEGGEAGPR